MKEYAHSNAEKEKQVVEKLQETHQELSRNLMKAQELKESSLEIKKEYEENLNKVKKEKKKTIKNIKNKFDVEMMEARGEIKKILDELRKEKNNLSSEIGLLMRDKKVEEANKNKVRVVEINDELIHIEEDENKYNEEITNN